MSIQASDTTRAQTVLELTQAMVHRYYGENDVEFILSLLDPHVMWMGAGEHEFAVGQQTVSQIFRNFVGQVPKCNISQEEFHVVELAPDAYVCCGRMWIQADPSTQIFLRVHQRITTTFRWRDGEPRCCHIHISNPYQEMIEEDMGFPTRMARHSYEYLQEQLEAQKQQIQDQTEMLRRMSYEDALTGLHNRHMFHQVVQTLPNAHTLHLGVACFDLNGLKETNDKLGHGAGDQLLCRAAQHLSQAFPHEVYRTGGDEFVIINDQLQEQDFYGMIYATQQRMERDSIPCSVGVSWRSYPSSMKEQLEEADRRMYEEKRRYYSFWAHDRRNRGR